METTIYLSEEEVASLQDFTSESDPSAALRAAMIEYLRYAKRMRLKDLSGQVEVEDNWQALEDAELREHGDTDGSGSG